MESSSPENCLPEADSLPDGFVDSSAERSPPPPSSVDALDRDYKDPFIDLEPAVDPSVDYSPPQQMDDGGQEPVHGSDSLEGSATDSNAEKLRESDIGGSRELHNTSITEGSTLEANESLKNKKQESSETKKKATKRSLKSDKELLEFTFQYRKVVAERDSALAVRERLESLCRELQRQNKILMDECQRVSTEGQNMRLDLSNKFNNAIKDVSSKLELQKDECLGQLKENEMLRSKLKHLADQYALTEQQFEAKLKQKTLELQLADLKLQQEQERSAQEHTQMQSYAEQVSQLLDTEKNLRLQLAADGEKFQQFQVLLQRLEDALLKSNEVFETFKQEMEKMAKLIKDLKKDNAFLKNKCEQSDYAIVKLIEERENMKKQIEKIKNQKEKLESLCRLLQAERKQQSTEVTDSSPVTSVQEKVEPGDRNS